MDPVVCHPRASSHLFVPIDPAERVWIGNLVIRESQSSQFGQLAQLRGRIL